MQQKLHPLITVITATFNSEIVLERCITSVINQTYSNVEHVIIDGSSTDSTVDIIKKYDDQIRWLSEPDSGIYEAWNKGVTIAKGEWITFIGSDDYLYPTALADYVDFINKLHNPNLQFVSSKMHLVNKDGKIIRSLGWPWDWKKCRLKNLIAHPGALHHKNMYNKFGLYDTSFEICADYELLLRPGKDFNTAFMDKFTVKMQIGGISANGGQLFKEQHKAAVETGKLNIVVAKYYYVLQMAKFYTKKILLKIGIER